MVDVLVVSLGSTFGLRAADDELAASLRRAGASVALVRAPRPRAEVRTFMATDLVWALAARRAALRGIARCAPRAVVYGTTTSALLWPRPGAIRFDALAADTRPGRHGLWQRPVERRRLAQAPLLVPQVDVGTGGVVVPIPVEPSGPVDGAAARDIAAITYAANPSKKGLDRVLAAWAAVRRDGEELWVCGTPHVPEAPGVVAAGSLAPEAYRALLRRAKVFVTAPRREDYGVAQLEALADGCVLVTTAAPGPYAALPLARALDPALVVAPDALGGALRRALDDVDAAAYAPRAAALLAPFSRAAVDAVVRDELLPRLLPPPASGAG